MAAPAHHYETRAAAAAANAPPDAPPNPPPIYPHMITHAELRDQCDTPLQTLRLLEARGMLLPFNRPCPRECKSKKGMALYESSHYTDGWCLLCTQCSLKLSPRSGSLFAEFETPIRDLVGLLLLFDEQITVATAARMTTLHRNTVSKFYKYVRQRIQVWLAFHPIIFGPGEIVEIDELYLKPLYHERPARQRPFMPPTIGLISRTTGAVALEICASHKTADISGPILRHLPHPETVAFTDEASSFFFLKDHVDYKTAWYEKRAGSKWLEPHREHLAHGKIVTVHTNTIEGYWSKLRGHLQDSHGWEADYLPLFLCECMFRSLRLPLTAPLRA